MLQQCLGTGQRQQSRSLQLKPVKQLLHKLNVETGCAIRLSGVPWVSACDQYCQLKVSLARRGV